MILAVMKPIWGVVFSPVIVLSLLVLCLVTISGLGWNTVFIEFISKDPEKVTQAQAMPKGGSSPSSRDKSWEGVSLETSEGYWTESH